MLLLLVPGNLLVITLSSSSVTTTPSPEDLMEEGIISDVPNNDLAAGRKVGPLLRPEEEEVEEEERALSVGIMLSQPPLFLVLFPSPTPPNDFICSFFVSTPKKNVITAPFFLLNEIKISHSVFFSS